MFVNADDTYSLTVTDGDAIDDGSGGHMRTKNVIHEEKQVARSSC